MIDFAPTIVTVVAILLAFVVGWNWSVSRWKAQRLKLIAHLGMLEAAVSHFHELENVNPQRAWTNAGIGYALSEIEDTIEKLKEVAISRAEGRLR